MTGAKSSVVGPEPYHVLSPPRLPSTERLAEHLDRKLTEGWLIVGFFGTGQDSGKKLLDACRHLARSRPLWLRDPSGESRLWEHLASQGRPLFPAATLDHVEWRLFVKPGPFTLGSDVEIPDFGPGAEAILEDGRGRHYFLGAGAVVRGAD